jgi:catechol 2,3-dioxygenase-like lactoylglutathione lyase family enzyme
MIITIFVANMDRAVKFYSEILGCNLEYRFGDHWAQLRSDDGATIGLHPASSENPVGIKGSIQLGINVREDIHKVVEGMKSRGVKFNGAVSNDQQNLFANFEDPDDNPLYLAEVKSGDWSQSSSAA